MIAATLWDVVSRVNNPWQAAVLIAIIAVMGLFIWKAWDSI